MEQARRDKSKLGILKEVPELTEAITYKESNLDNNANYESSEGNPSASDRSTDGTGSSYQQRVAPKSPKKSHKSSPGSKKCSSFATVGRQAKAPATVSNRKNKTSSKTTAASSFTTNKASPKAGINIVKSRPNNIRKRNTALKQASSAHFPKDSRVLENLANDDEDWIDVEVPVISNDAVLPKSSPSSSTVAKLRMHETSATVSESPNASGGAREWFATRPRDGVTNGERKKRSMAGGRWSETRELIEEYF